MRDGCDYCRHTDLGIARYCMMCGRLLTGEVQGDVQFLDCRSASTAKRLAPWAERWTRLKDGGYLAFSKEADYREWVEAGREFEKPRRSLYDIPRPLPPLIGETYFDRTMYRGRLFYVDCTTPKTMRKVAPWARKVLSMQGGGFMVFEYEEDWRVWKRVGKPFIPDPWGEKKPYGPYD